MLPASASRLLFGLTCYQVLLSVLQGHVAHFHLHKFGVPATRNQYRWKLSDQQQACTEALNVSFEGTGDTVDLQGEQGEAVVAVDLCRSAYYTVIKFEWKVKSYRY